jgi:RNA polymerase sigma-70 factor (ECF subfamily)
MKITDKKIWTDEQLVMNLLGGNPECMGILYQRYYSKVYHKCLSFTHNSDDAFDLAQDVMLKAFSRMDTFRGQSLFSTWLYAITHNHCITWSMQLKRKSCLEAGSYPRAKASDEEQEDLDSRSAWEDIEWRIDEYLNRLPVSYHRILELKYRHNYSVKDLQQEFNLTPSAVKMRLQRARQKMEEVISCHPAA